MKQLDSGATGEVVPLKSDEDLWLTNDGQWIRFSAMNDRHVFMTFKMLFNHCAPRIGLETVQFTRVWDGMLRRSVMDLLIPCSRAYREIQSRGGPPQEYTMAFHEIEKQLLRLANWREYCKGDYHVDGESVPRLLG